MVANTLLMRFQADILDMDVVVPSVVETTVLGAAYGAGLASGIWSSASDIADHWREAVRYRPSMGSTERERLVRGWSKAVDRSLGWVED
jgi:glycerol kinase